MGSNFFNSVCCYLFYLNRMASLFPAEWFAKQSMTTDCKIAKKREPKKAKSQKECISQVWFGKKLRNQMIYHLIYLTKVIVYFCLLRKITTKKHKLSTYWTWKFSSHKSSGGLDYVKEEYGLKKYSQHFWNQQFKLGSSSFFTLLI